MDCQHFNIDSKHLFCDEFGLDNYVFDGAHVCHSRIESDQNFDEVMFNESQQSLN